MLLLNCNINSLLILGLIQLQVVYFMYNVPYFILQVLYPDAMEECSPQSIEQGRTWMNNNSQDKTPTNPICDVLFSNLVTKGCKIFLPPLVRSPICELLHIAPNGERDVKLGRVTDGLISQKGVLKAPLASIRSCRRKPHCAKNLFNIKTAVDDLNCVLLE